MLLKFSAACGVLGKRFGVTPDTFERLPRALVMEWAEEVRLPGYVLRTWQHRFLVGEDVPQLHRTKLIERLSVPSLVGVSEASGRSIQNLFHDARAEFNPAVIDQAVS